MRQLNIVMKDIYVDKFSALIDETSQRTGLHFDPMIQGYVSVMLANYVEKTQFFSEPFGTRYMNIQNSTNAKELGDSCLVLVGFFSGYRGMSDHYYSEIGAGSYYVAANATGSEIFKTMAHDFYDLRELLKGVHPPKFF